MTYASTKSPINIHISSIEQPVDCSHVFMSLNMATGHVITPHTHQWYRINIEEILQDHELALCDGKVAHMVPLPPAINIYMTISRVMLQQNQHSQNNAHGKQPQCTCNPLVNQPAEWSHQS